MTYQITPDTAPVILKGLHATSRAPAANDQAWMKQTAGRIEKQTGQKVRTESAVAFLEDVFNLGLLDQL